MDVGAAIKPTGSNAGQKQLKTLHVHLNRWKHLNFVVVWTRISPVNKMNKCFIICIINQPIRGETMMKIAFVTVNSRLVPLIEGLSAHHTYWLFWNRRIILLGKTHRMTISWWKGHQLGSILVGDRISSTTLTTRSPGSMLTLPDYFIAANAHPHTATIYAVWWSLQTYHGKVMTNRPTHQHSCIDEEPSRIAQNENPPW